MEAQHYERYGARWLELTPATKEEAAQLGYLEGILAGKALVVQAESEAIAGEQAWSFRLHAMNSEAAGQ